MKKVKEARELLKNREAVPLEGKHLVADGLRWGLKPLYLFLSKEDPQVIALAEKRGISPIFIGERAMRSLSSLKTPPGELLLVAPPQWKEEDFSKIVVLEEVQDPTNVGSILRTAYCLGYDAVYIDAHSAHPFSPKTVRASAGYSLRMPVFRVALPEKLREWKGRKRILGTFPKGGEAPKPLKEDFVLIFGNESRGISPQLSQLVERKLTIPMERGESLGVAASAAILLYLLRG